MAAEYVVWALALPVVSAAYIHTCIRIRRPEDPIERLPSSSAREEVPATPDIL
eukprot:COSAG01_NODE_787_length_13598_cov_17.218535_2_plen_53_part_00